MLNSSGMGVQEGVGGGGGQPRKPESYTFVGATSQGGGNLASQSLIPSWATAVGASKENPWVRGWRRGAEGDICPGPQTQRAPQKEN